VLFKFAKTKRKLKMKRTIFVTWLNLNGHLVRVTSKWQFIVQIVSLIVRTVYRTYLKTIATISWALWIQKKILIKMGNNKLQNKLTDYVRPLACFPNELLLIAVKLTCAWHFAQWFVLRIALIRYLIRQMTLFCQLNTKHISFHDAMRTIANTARPIRHEPAVATFGFHARL